MATLAVISYPKAVVSGSPEAKALDEKQRIETLAATRSWHFDSRSNGAGHEVRIRIATDGTPYLTCTCPGGKYAWAGDRKGTGCWAMKTVRAEYGLR